MRNFLKRPLLIPALSFLSGICAAGMAGLNFSLLMGKALAAIQLVLLVLSFFAIRSKRFYIFSIVLFFFALGSFRYFSVTAPKGTDISHFLTETPVRAFIYGEVSSDPEAAGRSRFDSLSFNIDLKKIILNAEEKNVSGKIKAVIYFPGEKAPGFGDMVAVSGKISLPRDAMNPAEHDFRGMSYRTGIRARFSSSRSDLLGIVSSGKGFLVKARRSLSALRQKAVRKLEKALSRQALAMAESVTLGIRSEINSRTRDILTRTGTMHILAVSGLHVGMAAVIFLVILRQMGLPLGARNLLASLGILAFAALTGFRASSLRAAIMGSLLLFSSASSRKPDIINALGVSAFIITFFDPGQFFSWGFILSYLAVISIALLIPLTDHFLFIGPAETSRSGKIKIYFLKTVSVSMAVWIGTMPVIASYFRIITPSCLLANIIAVPGLFILIVLSAVVIFMPEVLFFPFVSRLAAMLVSGLTEGLMKVLHFIGSLPGGFVRVAQPGAAISAVFYAALILAIFAFRRKAKRLYLAVFLIAAANLFVWKEVSLSPPENTKITFFSTGRSDASLLEFPDGKVMLIDAGTAGERRSGDSARDVILPYLAERGIRKIDCALITHPHEDHIGGFPCLLKELRIGTLIDSSLTRGKEVTRLYTHILETAGKKNIPRVSVKKGDLIKGFQNTRITVLNPPESGYYENANSDSIVLKMVMPHGLGVLFSGDAESPALKGMLTFGEELEVDVLKVPHHAGGLGERTAVEEFLRCCDAEYMVVTNKRGCKINRPIAKKAEDPGKKLLLTGKCGAVTVFDDPDGFSVDTKLGS